MDKFGWQRPNIEPGVTGIQAACAASKMRKRAAQVETIAAGNVLAKARESEIQKLGE